MPPDVLCGCRSLLPETLRSRTDTPSKHQERFFGCKIDADILTFHHLRTLIGVLIGGGSWGKGNNTKLKANCFKTAKSVGMGVHTCFPIIACPLHAPLNALPQEVICLYILHEAKDFHIYSERILPNRPKIEPLNPRYHTCMGLKNKFLTLEERDCNLQLTATFSRHFVSNFLVAVLSEVLPGILPNQSYAICYNDCRSQSNCWQVFWACPHLRSPS